MQHFSSRTRREGAWVHLAPNTNEKHRFLTKAVSNCTSHLSCQLLVNDYIYIFFFYFRIFKNGFLSAHLANRQKNPCRLGSERKNPRMRVERNESTREILRGCNLTSSLDFNASSRGCFEPLWFSSSRAQGRAKKQGRNGGGKEGKRKGRREGGKEGRREGREGKQERKEGRKEEEGRRGEAGRTEPKRFKTTP